MSLLKIYMLRVWQIAFCFFWITSCFLQIRTWKSLWHSWIQIKHHVRFLPRILKSTWHVSLFVVTYFDWTIYDKVTSVPPVPRKFLNIVNWTAIFGLTNYECAYCIFHTFFAISLIFGPFWAVSVNIFCENHVSVSAILHCQ